MESEGLTVQVRNLGEVLEGSGKASEKPAGKRGRPRKVWTVEVGGVRVEIWHDCRTHRFRVKIDGEELILKKSQGEAILKFLEVLKNREAVEFLNQPM